MKTNLFLLLISSVILLSTIGVYADQNPIQTVTADVDSVVNATVSPSTLEFGHVLQGSNGNPAQNGPITFSEDEGANTNMTITVTNITGAPFSKGLKFDGVDPTTLTFHLNCLIAADVCTYTQQTTVPTLDVPARFPASSPSGVITYSITGATP